MSQYYTAKGFIDKDSIKRVMLFDGQFDTGYKIVEFSIAPSNFALDPDAIARLSTEELTTTAREWNWGDNREKAWAAWQSNGANAVNSYFADWVPDIIVEDLFISTYTSTGQGLNYKIVFEKVKISEYEGALAMVRNQSQG